MRKKILYVGEASHLATGYSTYSKEVLSRLYETGKYEIAELACYVQTGDPNLEQFPWRIYANVPHMQDRHGIQQYESNPIHQFGSWRFEEVCLDFKPDMVCVPPGEHVMTEQGYKKIEEIKPGEKVLTHKGRFKKVLATSKTQFNGNLVTIYANGCCIPLKLTPNHPVLVFKKRRQTNRKKSNAKIYEGIQPEFVASSDVKQGDLVVLSYPKSTKKPTFIDISEYLVQFNEKGGELYPSTYGGPIPKIIKLDEKLSRLCGYIIADGCVSDSGVNICFHATEKRFVDDVVQLWQEIFGLNATVKDHREYPDTYSKNMWEVRVHSVLLAEFMTKWLGGSRARKIPECFWKTSKKNKENLVCGMVRGDGCYKRNTVSFATSYIRLVNEYRLLAASVGIPTNISTRKPRKGQQQSYEVNGYGGSSEALHKIVNKHDKSIKTTPKKIVRSTRNTQMINGYLVAAVNRVRQDFPYTGQVYNLEVEEDNSYIVNQYCVHNCSIRDYWMDEFLQTSPFRPYYNLAMMPTVDSAPQDLHWVDTYSQADAIATYTDFGIDTLKGQAGNRINFIGSLPAGANLNIYKPVADKTAYKQSVGFSPDTKIVGTVMRNQKRKLFPDLFRAFRDFIEQTQDNKTFLYCHTSYPDAGWDIPRILAELGIGHKVLFTYSCRSCRHTQPSFFQTAKSVCPRCGKLDFSMPNTQTGVSQEELCRIYNLFDVYVQYSIAEGQSVPIAEAAACGVPVMVVDYSGMTWIRELVGGTPIKVERFFRESETHTYRCYPDNNHLVEELIKFFNLPEPIRRKMGFEARKSVEEHLTYEKTAKGWENYFDTVIPKNAWNSPPRLHKPITQVPPGLGPQELVEWSIINILGEPEKLNTYFAMRLIRDLNMGFRNEGFGGVYMDDVSFIGQRNRNIPFGPNEMFNMLTEMCAKRNYWEQRRTGLIKSQIPDFIALAKKERK